MGNQLFKLLHGMYHAGIPVMVWSDPGLGKTSTINFLAEVLKVPLEMRSGNKSSVEDFSGIPYVVDGQVHYSTPRYVRTCQENPGSILFFDEITTCTPSAQAPMLSIIQDCQFGEFKIPESTFRIAAGNYSTVAGCNNMSPALMNRFTHIFATSDLEYLCDGFISNWKNYEIAVINSPADREKKKIYYNTAVVGFWRENPNEVHTFNEEIINDKDVAYPTPRTWSNLVTILSTLDGNDPEYIRELVHGTIGEGVGDLFLKYLDGYEGLGVDIPSYVGREQDFRFPDPDRHDKVCAIVASMEYYFDTDPVKYFPLWKMVINVANNKDKKYGSYIGYKSVVMKYLFKDVQTLINSKILQPKDLNTLGNEIDCYDSVMAVSSV